MISRKKGLRSTISLSVSVICLTGCYSTHPGNAKQYLPEQFTAKTSVLTGKSYYWLGSSVTLGMAALDHAVPDYLDAMNGCHSVKEAKSGTTLFGEKNSQSYLGRLLNSKAFDKDAEIDGFFVQISTNDAKKKFIDHLGEVPEGYQYQTSDIETSLGAMDYIIGYVVDTWHCPVYLYSNAYFSDSGPKSNKETLGSDYEKLIAGCKGLSEKWNAKTDLNVHVSVMDLFHDETLNDISDENYSLYMYDAIHPTEAGYALWWTPYVESCLVAELDEK